MNIDSSPVVTRLRQVIADDMVTFGETWVRVVLVSGSAFVGIPVAVRTIGVRPFVTLITDMHHEVDYDGTDTFVQTTSTILLVDISSVRLVEEDLEVATR